MHTPTVAALLHCFLFAALVQSAPITSPAFSEAVKQTKTLVEKILDDIPIAHTATVNTQGFTLDASSHTTNLQLMVTSLGIPATPVLKPPSQHFTPDMCVARMLAGTQLYQNLLEVLSSNLSGLETLQADLRDLLTHIAKMKKVAQLGGDASDQNHSLDLASHLQEAYKVQVMVHMTLVQLRSFCHDLIRSLRALATYRPDTAGAQ
ncbi:uncharacterized protein LOC121651656 [Melanotaenia boesemani]|uniref:uncharacterized protein LOC121651656 n=1 Tax=Melanotaenia boesemani TaxID=1250792 RepID=UPI001C03ECC9|nr:uncharacterized protein LOC121651656 [Melanotaenia boesemani]